MTGNHFKRTRSMMAILASVASCSFVQAQNILTAQTDLDGNSVIEWTGLDGYTYDLQYSSDLEFWQTDSTWPGVGQNISVIVHDAPINNGGGGAPAAIPGLPQYNFAVARYSDGSTLIGWIGADGNPYQLYTTFTYFGVGDPPLFSTEVDDPENGDYKLFLHQFGTGVPPSNAASLTFFALPVEEQERVFLLTSVHQQIIDELAAGNVPSDQTGAVGTDVGDAGYFRLVIRRLDSDGDGLYDNLEGNFGLNPFDPDTDQNGVTDPWDFAQLQNVIISEFMAANTATVRDGNDPGQFEDYIELFNPTLFPVDLTGYFLSCSQGNPLRWVIPAGFILAPGQSRIIFASGNNVTDPDGNPHTDFGLSASGEHVILSAPNGTVIDSHIDYGRQRTNASAGWGLDQETGLVSKLRFFLDPTPGAVNSPVSCTGFSESPLFDMNGGIFSNSVETIGLSPAIAGVQGETIHYTLDGSNPTQDSPLYTGPIDIDSTTIVRAISVRPGCIPSPVVTRSLLFKEDVIGTAGQGQPVDGSQVRPNNYPVFAKRLESILEPVLKR